MASTIIKTELVMYKTLQVKMKIVSLDIETYSDSLEFPEAYHPLHEVFMISLVFQTYKEPSTRKRYCLHTVSAIEDDDVEIVPYANELKLLEGYADLIIKEDPTIITGYNILGFDLPYMHRRMARVAKPFYTHGLAISDKGLLLSQHSKFFGEAHYIESSGRIMLDVQHQVMADMKLPSYKLLSLIHI